MFTERLSRLPETLPDYRPFPPAECRPAWQGLPSDARKRLLSAGEAALLQAIPQLPLQLWLDFTRTGNRSAWEEAYFSRRTRLSSLVCAECVEYKGRFLNAIADTVWAICEESAWQLPAHNSYIRDTPQLPLPDTSRPIIDLFAAETGALLALTCYLLKDCLDEALQPLKDRIVRELHSRILEPYLHDHFWWMGNGPEPMCNWTSWCTQNVLLCFFLLPTGPAKRQAAVRQAAESLDCFLKDYGEDGCCNEGAQYYRHAGLTLFGCLELLSAAAPDAFRPLYQEKKIRNIAEYILNVHVRGPYYLNFGDCSPLAGRCGAREFLFGQAVGSDALCALAAEDFRADPDPDHLTNPDATTHINLWYRLLTAFHEDALRRFKNPAAAADRAWYPSTGLFIRRKNGWVLGVKMGSNGDSHNHNDTGSLTLYRSGQPFLIDIGVESYTKKTFSPRRYEIWTMQSRWHNLPTFDGVQQLPGADYAAADIRLGEDGISAELSGAYPPINGLHFYRRSVHLSDDGAELLDETDYPGRIELTLLTAQQPVWEGSGWRIGDLGHICCDAPPEGSGTDTGANGPHAPKTVIDSELQAVPITDPRLRSAWPDTIYRICLHFTKRLALRFTAETAGSMDAKNRHPGS